MRFCHPPEAPAPFLGDELLACFAAILLSDDCSTIAPHLHIVRFPAILQQFGIRGKSPSVNEALK